MDGRYSRRFSSATPQQNSYYIPWKRKVSVPTVLPSTTVQRRASLFENANEENDFTYTEQGLPIQYFPPPDELCVSYHYHVFQNNHGLLSLDISKVRDEDAGTYTVTAVNSEGEVACTATLEVEGK